MGWLDYAILAAVVGLVVLAVAVNRKSKKDGKGCCGGGNNGCEHCKDCEYRKNSEK